MYMTDTQHQSSFFCWWNNFLSHVLKMGVQKKMTVWENLNLNLSMEIYHAEYLPRGLAIFLVKKNDFQRKNMASSSHFQMLISACFSQTMSYCLVL